MVIKTIFDPWKMIPTTKVTMENDTNNQRNNEKCRRCYHNTYRNPTQIQVVASNGGTK